MGPHDRVLFHAVTHVRLFAEAEHVGPRAGRRTLLGPGLALVYPCRVDTWVSLIGEGLHTSEIAPKKALGRIRRGGDFAQLSEDENRAIYLALQGLPNIHPRE